MAYPMWTHIYAYKVKSSNNSISTGRIQVSQAYDEAEALSLIKRMSGGSIDDNAELLELTLLKKRNSQGVIA